MIEMINLYYVLRAYPISLIHRFIERRIGAQETSRGIFLAEHFPLQAHPLSSFCQDKEKVLLPH